METLKEIFQSLIDGYKERTKSPLIGSFMISFFFFNWKYFAIIFYSEWAMHCRIEWIEEKYKFQYNFGIPLVISLFYVLILPYLNIFFEICLKKYTDFKTVKSNQLKIDKLKQKVIEAKEQRNIADAKAGTSEINNLNERNKSLAKENESLVKQNSEDIKRHTSILEQYKEREKEFTSEIDILKVSSELYQKELKSLKDGIRYGNLYTDFPSLSDEIKKADKNLSNIEKLAFFNHFRKVNSGQKSQLTDSILTNKFFNYKLMAPGYGGDKEYMLTDIGDAFYQLLINDGFEEN